MEVSLPITVWKSVLGCNFLLNIGRRLPFSFPFMWHTQDTSNPPSHTHVHTPHLSLFYFAYPTYKMMLPPFSLSLCLLHESPGYFHRAEEKRHKHNSNDTVENKSHRHSLVFKAVTVTLQVHLGNIVRRQGLDDLVVS